MQVQLLGPLRVVTDEGHVAIGSHKQRALLCLLALSAGEAISAESLIYQLWGEDSPATAQKTLQTHVVALRKVLPAGVLKTATRGYLLDLDTSSVDARRFENLYRKACQLEREGNRSSARDALEEALSLWRGEALMDLIDSPSGAAETVRLSELRRTAEEELFDLRLVAGEHSAAVSDLEAAVAAEPLRERRWAQLITALYRSGRRAEALRAYQRLRIRLGEELGIEPSADVSALEAQVVRQDPRLDWINDRGVGFGAPREGALPPSGTVTFLMSDLEGSTRLWDEHPEQMGVAVPRHDAIMRSSIAAANGYVFSTTGDSFSAAFTAARDAIRAARQAQITLSEESWPVNLRVRMALHTGTAEERDGYYFGPVLNRTAGLRAVSHGGQVVLSSATAGLVADNLPERSSLRDLGEHRLKDLGRHERVFELVLDELPNEFPPLRSLDNPSLGNNLPILASTFVGRVKELADLSRLVAANRIVTICGVGGSGKTRLSLQLAAEVLDGSEEGVWFIDLAPLTDPEQVPAAVVSTLRLQARPGLSITESILDVLKGQHLLLVLDNCEHLIDASAKLADQIARTSPSVRIVSTSREPLSIDGEVVYRVPPLSLAEGQVETLSDLASSDAAQLFLNRALAHDPGRIVDDKDAPLVAQLCQLVDGIPLALELAAARLSSLSLSETVSRLDDRFSLLTKGLRTALPRQQTLEALVRWSYDLLNPAEQEVLRRLSVFPGSFESEAAEALGIPTGEKAFFIVDILSSLVDKSLLEAERQQGKVRYRFLETIRRFAADRFKESEGIAEVARAQQAHADFYLALAQRAGPDLIGGDQSTWLERFDAEWDNIRGTFAFLAAPKSPADARRHLRLLLDQIEVFNFFPQRQEYYDLLLRYESIAQDLGDAALLAALYTQIGELRYEWGQYESSIRTLTMALEYCDASGDVANAGLAYGSLVWAYAELGEFARAIECHQQAIESFAMTFHALGYQTAMCGIGATYLFMGRWRDALDEINVGIRRGSDESYLGIVSVLDCAGAVVCFEMGDVARADEYIRACIEAAPTQWSRAQGEGLRLALACAMGDADELLPLVEQGVQAVKTAGHETWWYVFATYLADAYLVRGDMQKGVEQLQEIRSSAERSGAKFHQAAIRRRLGEAALLSGHLVDGQMWLTSALEIATPTGCLNEQALALAALGRLHRARGEEANAIRCIDEAERILKDLGTLDVPRRLDCPWSRRS